MDVNKLLLRPIEAAEAMGVSRSKAYELISSGTIPSIRIGGSVRVPLEALRTWIARQVPEVVETPKAGKNLNREPLRRTADAGQRAERSESL